MEVVWDHWVVVFICLEIVWKEAELLEAGCE